MVAIPGLSGRIFKKAAKTKEPVLLQSVSATSLLIADSCFQPLESPVSPTSSKSSKRETEAEVKERLGQHDSFAIYRLQQKLVSQYCYRDNGLKGGNAAFAVPPFLIFRRYFL